MENSLWPGWRTVRKIGTGSYGTVYEIERDFFGEPEKAALKVMSIPRNQYEIEELRNEGYDDENINIRFESYLKDIVHEYSLMAKMKGNSNTVYCDDIKYERSEDGIGWTIYIKMELLTPLVKTLSSVRDDAQILKLAHDICSALVMCRRFNIVHRDIKPQNIFVAKDGTFKLGDFGIAKTSDRTTSGTVVGTYKYMAPEVFNNQPYGSSADIYSLGMVLYWLLNERRTPFLPLPPKVPTAAMEDDARRRRFQGEAIPAPKNGSPALKKIVLKACAYDAADRYGSAAEMLSAINRASKAAMAKAGILSPDRTEELPERTGAAPRTGSGAGRQFRRRQSEAAGNDLSVTELTPRLPASEQPSPAEQEKGTATVALIHAARETAPPAEQGVPEDAGEQKKAKKGFRSLRRGTKAEKAKPKRPASAAVGEALKKRFGMRRAAAAEAGPDAQEAGQRKKKRTAGIIAAAAGLAVVAGGAILLFSGWIGGQKNWSEWADSLPGRVTADKYSIEERTLYSTRQMETTQSTESDQMDGWELYDSAEGNGEFGAWSAWTEKKQTASDTREVETQLRYRYSEKETAESDSDSMPGWTLEETTTAWNDYGEWSAWSQTAVSGSDSREVQTQTKYRYRTKETTTSSSASLSGWTSDGSTTTGGEWSDWSAWSESNPGSKSSTLDVRSKTQYSVRVKDTTSSTSSSLSGWTLDYYTEEPSQYFSDWSETPIPENENIIVSTDPTGRYYHYQEIIRTYYYYKWSGWSEYKDSLPASDGREREERSITVYSYRTRTPETTTYKFYRWTGWSDWTTTPVSKTGSRDVQTQTSYRYRDRTGVPVYHFYRWKNWSAWSETEAEQTDGRRVEKKTFYRYRDRVNETTYYFRRWTDWTEYTEAPAEPGEDLEVQTKTQYRYRRKDDSEPSET